MLSTLTAQPKIVDHNYQSILKQEERLAVIFRLLDASFFKALSLLLFVFQKTLSQAVHIGHFD